MKSPPSMLANLLSHFLRSCLSPLVAKVSWANASLLFLGDESHSSFPTVSSSSLSAPSSAISSEPKLQELC